MTLFFNGSCAAISDLWGQKLIFKLTKNGPDLSYYPIDFENECDIRDQHVLFYHSIKITNGKKTKSFLWISEGDPRHKKLTFRKVPKKVVENDQNFSDY